MVDVIERLEEDKIDIRRANAIANACGKALAAVAVQLEYERLKIDGRLDHFIPELDREAEPRKIHETKA
jgi:hypothetical protein